MFMFRSRRTTLTKRLLKARCKRVVGGGCGGSSGGGEGGSNSTSNNNNNNNHDQENPSNSSLESVVGLLRRLQENQLVMLWAAVESRGRDQTSMNCVLLPKNNISDDDDDEDDGRFHNLEPHVLCCQTWRWPDLTTSVHHHHLRQGGGELLRRIPACRSACDPYYVCCNPYHWSRIYQPESPPPPYSRCVEERLKPEDRPPSEAPLLRPFPESLTTSGEESCRNPREWCKLAYWELAQRVGPLFPVETPAVNIFGNVPYGDGLSLETLAQHNCNPPESVLHARCKIGLGVTLSREGDYVWVYNRSDSPIFVNSPTLDICNNSTDYPTSAASVSLLPTRVPAEQCLCVYDPVKASAYHEKFNNWNNCMTPPCTGPVNTNSIRISFAKGWGGSKYRRQDITSCPCWLEILLAPCR